jgi:hypothetical protein
MVRIVFEEAERRMSQMIEQGEFWKVWLAWYAFLGSEKLSV